MTPTTIAPSVEQKRQHYGWLVLFLVLSVILTTVWFREGDNGPLHKVRVGVQTVTTPLGNAGKWATTPMRRFGSWVMDLGVSRSQLQTLRDQNETLRARVVELEEARLENDRLKALIGEVSKNGYSGIGAAVIGLPENTYDQVIVLNKGSSDGVSMNVPVVTSRGLLGQIIEVGPTYSKVRLITDQKSGVAALIQRDRLPGVIRGSLAAELTLDFVDMDAKVIPGDVVLTSGLGGIYPKGLVIGEVTDVSNGVNTLFKTISVRPANTLANLEEVLVLTDAPPNTQALPDATSTEASPNVEGGT
jgi:rod shape-determining protein MreC